MNYFSMIKGKDATRHEVGRRFLHLKAEADTAGSLSMVSVLPQQDHHLNKKIKQFFKL